MYERFRKPILSYVSSRLSDAETAEEVTQEVFIKAYRFQETYDERYALSTWLWTIARNTVYDVLRRDKSREELGAGDLDLGVSPEDLPSALQDPEHWVERRDTRKMLLKLLRPLTSLQRRVLWMAIVQQRSYEEISRQLGLSLSAVKNLAYRARLALLQGLALHPDLSLA